MTGQGKEVSDMVKFFTNRLELAQTSSMLFVESTYFFFAFCWSQEEIRAFMQLSSITMPSFSILSWYATVYLLFLFQRIERNRPCSVYLALSKVFLWNAIAKFTIFLSSGIILSILMNWGTQMKEFNKSIKLEHVAYDIRGPVLE